MSDSETKEYRKKPVVIRAYQTKAVTIIKTLEGDMRADPGDWIITGVKGERYPCKPDIFAATYEDAALRPHTTERMNDVKERDSRNEQEVPRDNRGDR
ncbi:hypothetical protein [Botrimarina mediterranea]|uniref:hypothetical protein n=1 Tax=Botrimarina mediterranea TaxID=2528022 RepID=UPI003AF327A0